MIEIYADFFPDNTNNFQIPAIIMQKATLLIRIMSICIYI